MSGSTGWTWRGFVQLQRFLVDTDAISEPTLAALLLSEATSFKKDLDAARDASLVRDAQGRPFFVPPFAAANFTPYTSMTEGSLPQSKITPPMSALLSLDLTSKHLYQVAVMVVERHIRTSGTRIAQRGRRYP